MGGAQPLLLRWLVALQYVLKLIKRIKRRIENKYLDKSTDDIDEAIKWALSAKKNKEPISIGLLGNAAEIIPLFVKKI